MRKTLILWRHAQAEIGNDDFNRPIDDRGKKESKTMSEFLLSNASPDLTGTYLQHLMIQL